MCLFFNNNWVLKNVIEFHILASPGDRGRKCMNDTEGKERGDDKFWERGRGGTLTVKKNNKTKEEQNSYWESDKS